jgi:hypothetical protein
VTDKDAAAGVVPGLERAVAKSKGIEFGSLLHELGAQFSANPYSAAVRDILLSIEPQCQGRLPKRRADRAPQKPPAESAVAAEKPAAPKKPAAPVKPRPAAGAIAPPPPPAADAPKKKPAPAAESSSKPSAEKSAPKSAVSKKRPASEALSKRKPR